MIWDCDLGMELGKWNTRYCQLSSLHSSPQALHWKTFFAFSQNIFLCSIFLWLRNFSYFLLLLPFQFFGIHCHSLSLYPSQSLSLWNPNHHGRIQSSSSLKRSSSSRRWLRSSLPLSLSKSMHTYSYSSCIYSQLCMNLRILYAHPWIRFLLSHRLP